MIKEGTKELRDRSQFLGGGEYFMRLSWWGGAAVAPREPGLAPCPQAPAGDWAALDSSTCREQGGASGNCNSAGLLVKGNTQNPDQIIPPGQLFLACSPHQLVENIAFSIALPFHKKLREESYQNNARIRKQNLLIQKRLRSWGYVVKIPKE